MRTIKRHSRKLNKGKWETLLAIAGAYATEKDKWLCKLSQAGQTVNLRSDRLQRDILVKQGYKSENNLQARQWKQALKDSVETLDKKWKALFAELKPLIMGSKNLSETQRHYCFWVMSSYERLQKLLLRDYPTPEFPLTSTDLRQAGNYLNRIIRRHKGNDPRIRRARSFCVDADMYSIREIDGAQYIEIMTLQRGQRVRVPLLGNGQISGNLRIVLDNTKQTIEAHQTVEVCQRWEAVQGTTEALDFGYTEAFTDTEGKKYGEGLGKIISDFSDKLNHTGKARNKLYALQKKYREEGKSNKANNIKKYNLGYKKKDTVRHKAQAALSNKVNNGFNTLYGEKAPAVLITENLRHVFAFDKPKGVNRKLSSWIRGIIQDRAEFKALEGRSLHKQVNPAYGSQTCDHCGFVWNQNRKGDAFKCLFCGHEAASDRVAAMNYLTRSTDKDIGLYVPYASVKQILVSRFRRRLECWDFDVSPALFNWASVACLFKDWESLRDESAKCWSNQRTVAGRTPDTGRTTQFRLCGRQVFKDLSNSRRH